MVINLWPQNIYLLTWVITTSMEYADQIYICCSIITMLVELDGNSEPFAHAWRKIDRFGQKNPSCSRYSQVPQTYPITDIASDVCTYFWVTF